MARPRGDISERLIKAAREAFLTQGVDGASLREIAAEAGTSLGMITYYFPTKDDLFLAVLEQAYPKLLADLTAAVTNSGDGDLREKIERLYLHLHRVSDEEFAVVRILIREALVSSARLQKLFARFTGAGGHVPLMMSLLAQGQEQRALRTDLPPLGLLVAAIALGMAPMLVRRRLGELGADVPTPDVAASVMSTILFEGIGARPARAKPRRAKAAPKARRR
jgi:AcrR family transcriptional regulator